LPLASSIFDDFPITVEAPRLIERAFTVVEAGPLETVENLLDGIVRRALQIGILDAKYKLTRTTPGVQPRKQCGPQYTDVQEAGRTGSNSGADHVGLHSWGDALIWHKIAHWALQLGATRY
jgi:hypothetical protein